MHVLRVSAAQVVAECGRVRNESLNMSIGWGNETILHLIELYQSYGLLWDTANRDYRNKVKKNDAWDDIAKALNIPKKEIENEIHTLRAQFIREKRR